MLFCLQEQIGSRRGDHPGLAHPTSIHLAESIGSRQQIPRPHQEAAHGGSKALGEADGDRVEWASQLRG